jgi:hypothetical protein
LRVYMKLLTNTSMNTAPTLWAWRQLYDCVPAE